MEFSIVKAEKDLFAVYQTMYSKADIEMWYDWNRQLENTKWTDQCFFILLDGKKVGGIVLTENAIMYPFLVTPFCDRVKFWTYVLKHCHRNHIHGVLEEDARCLLMFDYKIDRWNQVMCRPTDVFHITLSNEFACRTFNSEEEAQELGNVTIQGYQGGICDEINGAATLESAIEDMKHVLSIYSKKDFSKVIVDKASNRIVALCLAGVGENYVHNYVEIADLCVLPEFRGKGIARYLIGRVINDSFGFSPFVKLFVYVGNRAEYLYHDMGFIGGPQFANMTAREQ